MTPRILLATYHFPPSNSVGARRPGRFARLLAKHGYIVDVVCADLNRRAVGARDPSQDEPQLSPEQTVHHVPTPFVLGRHPYRRPPKKGPRSAWWTVRARFEKRVLTRDWSWNWGVAGVKRVQRALDDRRYQLVMAEGPPNPPVLPFLRAASDAGIPSICDLRDVWAVDSPKNELQVMSTPTIRRLRWERQIRDQAVRLASHVILTSDLMADVMRGEFLDLDPSHFSAITNAFSEVDTAPRIGRESALRLVYTGSLAYGREALALNVVRAMGLMKRLGGPPLELTVAGYEGGALESLARRENVTEQVKTLGWIKGDRALHLQMQADILLLLQPSNLPFAIPGKLFDYMARRRPVLALVAEGPAADIVRDNELGEVVSTSRVEDLATALQRLIGRVRTHPVLPPPPEMYSEESTVAALAETIDRVLK